MYACVCVGERYKMKEVVEPFSVCCYPLLRCDFAVHYPPPAEITVFH